MTIRRYNKKWYIATIGGLSAVSQDRLEAQHLVLSMLAAQLETPQCPP